VELIIIFHYTNKIIKNKIKVNIKSFLKKMICELIVIALLYCLISGKYKDYVTLKIPIPGINSPLINQPTKVVYTPVNSPSTLI